MPLPSRPRYGLTLLETIIVIALIGIIVAILLPAVGAAREAARRAQCNSHLRQLAIAIHAHHNSFNRLPYGWQTTADNDTAYGWAVFLLEHIEQSELRRAIDVSHSVRAPWQAEARSVSLALFQCPSDIFEPRFVMFADLEDDSPIASSREGQLEGLVELPSASYVGVYGVYPPDEEAPARRLGRGPFVSHRTVRLRDFRRGLSDTLLIGERTFAQLPSTWLATPLAGRDAVDRLVGSACDGINLTYGDPCNFSSRHPQGSNFAWGDGHVKLVSEQIDLKVYRSLSRLNN